ncbi:hypothetical protein NDU88_006630 [Pleurodeles waltl]|uniref:Uncharacterized protein n=1 Tax=Pleurodeles waltl TaxID=8319 RepID=A0AAV7TY57_PLEWA|nr:hypothetical protein NDU88_006630 [Pleurodeles waltl]
MPGSRLTDARRTQGYKTKRDSKGWCRESRCEGVRFISQDPGQDWATDVITSARLGDRTCLVPLGTKSHMPVLNLAALMCMRGPCIV